MRIDPSNNWNLQPDKDLNEVDMRDTRSTKAPSKLGLRLMSHIKEDSMPLGLQDWGTYEVELRQSGTLLLQRLSADKRS